MVVAEIVTLFFYVISIAFLPEYFGEAPSLSSSRTNWRFVISFLLLTDGLDLSFVITTGFAWKVAVIVAISAVPLYIIKLLRKRFAPAASSKLL